MTNCQPRIALPVPEMSSFRYVVGYSASTESFNHVFLSRLSCRFLQKWSENDLFLYCVLKWILLTGNAHRLGYRIATFYHECSIRFEFLKLASGIFCIIRWTNRQSMLVNQIHLLYIAQFIAGEQCAQTLFTLQRF